MSKPLKIVLNILVFLLIAGFGYYMIQSILSDGKISPAVFDEDGNIFVSPYKKSNSFKTSYDIQCFDICEDTIYVATKGNISVFDFSGKKQREFSIEPDVRDIIIENGAFLKACHGGLDPPSNEKPTIDFQGIAGLRYASPAMTVTFQDSFTMYLLYHNRIDLFTTDGQKTGEWKACSENSNYCSFTTTKDYVFVTDIENKLMWQFDKQGGLVRMIKSPGGFIIPSYSFDIVNINDTIYCSNSGRHKIESYTIEGDFISSFGETGTQPGAFAGCCNPVYLEKTATGNILTSEKGNPRISCYNKEGTFNKILLDSKMLGGGTTAYKIRVSGDNIYIANGKTITIYGKDISSGQSCSGCDLKCPLITKTK